VYRRGGYYQLDIRRIQPSGLGALYAAFEALKRKLQQEGLFDESRKKPLPRTVRRLGVVTSKTGAAVRDIIRVVASRCPRTDIVLHNVLVQGERAAADIAGAIDRFNRRGDVDLLIVGRGGGSIEDLWAFNEEAVARAIAASTIPIISAVGHETDFTIADFVADARAATPSAAAEMAVPDEEEQRRYFGSLVRRFTAGYFRLFRQRRSDFDHLLSALALREPFRLAQEGRQSLDDARRRLYREMGGGLRQRGQTLAAQAGRLRALSPLGVLGRGYSIVSTEKGTVVKNSADLSVGQTIRVQFAKGRAGASVRDTET
jgi:exodeoxyribonuclease VII large subunit